MANISQHKVAIVTGASRGIGAAVAKRLAQDNVAVAVNYSSNLHAAEKVVEEIIIAGGRAAAIKADVSSPAEVAAMFDTCATLFGGIDILVNNAGIMSDLKPLADMDDDAFDTMFAVNVKGSFNTMRTAAKKLREGGQIINFSSSVTRLLLPTYAIYAAGKSAIETMTTIFAKELRGRYITVNAVAPGPTATSLFLNGKSDQQIEQLAHMAPLERLGQPEDIANAVAFLTSSDANWVNGQTLFVNGGIV